MLTSSTRIVEAEVDAKRGNYDDAIAKLEEATPRGTATYVVVFCVSPASPCP